MTVGLIVFEKVVFVLVTWECHPSSSQEQGASSSPNIVEEDKPIEIRLNKYPLFEMEHIVASRGFDVHDRS